MPDERDVDARFAIDVCLEREQRRACVLTARLIFRKRSRRHIQIAGLT